NLCKCTFVYILNNCAYRKTGYDVKPTNFISQPHLSMTAQLGVIVTLECYIPSGKVLHLVWYKQSIGGTPIHIAPAYSNSGEATMYEEFKNNLHFKVEKSDSSFNLTISSLEPYDVARYYCGAFYYSYMSFGNGTLLIIKGSETRNRSILQHPVSVPGNLGDDVTLKCTIQTVTCAGEHSVYWFRYGSEESLPGIIYRPENRRDQCEKRSWAGLPTNSCVYNLQIRNLSHSNAGINYCAVAACGIILFGNGTFLEITGVDHQVSLNYITLVLLATNIVAVLVITFLTCWLIKNHRTGFLSKGTHLGLSSHQHNQDTDVLNYAALSFTDIDVRPGRRRTEIDRQAVYSQVKY
uniref:Ig-like domain-containing protein n=1 Tax=Lepisosteus oculatus TaxID=7918 RepID=W5MPN9_LEPOC